MKHYNYCGLSILKQNKYLFFLCRISWQKITESIKEARLEDHVSSLYIVYASTPSIDEVPKNVIHTPKMRSETTKDYILTLADGSCQLYSFALGKLYFRCTYVLVLASVSAY